MTSFFSKIIEPNSKKEDDKRKEYLLNIILVWLISLSFVASIIVAVNMISIGKENYKGAPILVMVGIFLAFVILLYLSKIGKFKHSAMIVFMFMISAIIYTFYNWGIELPTGILVVCMSVVMSGILISTRYAFALTGIISLIVGFLGYLEQTDRIVPDLAWKKESLTASDSITFIIIFWIIALVSWLSNREIDKSLARARKSESALKMERDLLEVRVEERTHELRKAQQEKTDQLTQLAEFGRLASGIVHDLANPLTSILLCLEELEKKQFGKPEGVEKEIELALSASHKMEQFINLVKKQVQKQDVKKEFCPGDEIAQSIAVLAYKAKVAGVKIEVEDKTRKGLTLIGNQLKFSQAICNLVLNSIDACESCDKEKKIVSVLLEEFKQSLNIVISDNGCGIEQTSMDKIFDPFFTTKDPEKGTGLGLSIVKEIFERDFDGEIKLESEINKGTTFTINLPYA